MSFDNEKIDEGHLMDVFQIPEIDNTLLDIIDPALFTTQAERDSIELFVKTYSAYHIRNLTQTQKESLKQRLWHNQVLVTLIKNLDKPKLYKVDYLEGPFKFTLFQFNNKTVYLFGEVHKDTRDECISYGKPPPPLLPYGVSILNVSPTNTLRLNHFIELLSYDTPSFFDFYLETGTDDFYKVHDTNDFNTSWMFVYIFHLLYNNYRFFSERLFRNSLHGVNIISELDRIANDFVSRNNLTLPVSTGIIPDKELIDDLQSYYMSNRNIISFNINIMDFEMFDTRSKFSNCFQADKRKKDDKCRLGRFHNVDTRRILPDNRNVLEPLQMIIIIVSTQIHKEREAGYGWFFLLKQTGIEAFLEKILDASTGTSEENLFNHIIDMYPLVKKEWNRSYYKQEIKDFMKAKLKNIDISSLASYPGGPSILVNLDTMINNSLAMFRDVKATTTNAKLYKNSIKNMLYGFFKVGSNLMDIYCLSRVFKKFKIKTDCQPEETHNIIIYAGDAHSSTYSDFIVSLGHHPVYQTNNPNYSCVELGFNSKNPISNI